MKAKIILVSPTTGETVVGNMRSTVEAFQAAALFQAITNTPGYTYFVEYRLKGETRRTQPDSFRSTVLNLVTLTDHLRSVFV